MIREVTLRRFKRFTEQTFDVHGHVVLAGPNNCGKTTVLQAISAWASALGRWSELNDRNRRNGGYTRAPWARQAFSAVPLKSFDLLWTDRQQPGPVEIDVRLDDGRSIAVEIVPDTTEQVFVRPRGDVDPSGLSGPLPQVAYVATVGGLSVEEPVLQPAYIETLLGRQRPADVIRNLILLASQTPAWTSLVEAVRRMFGVDLLVPQTPGGQIVCEYRSRPRGPAFELSTAGSGMQQVVALLSCVFTRPGAILLVDEPDAHLHVFLQDVIFSELQRAAAGTHSQLILATHSEVIFNAVAPEQTCVMLGRPRRLATSADQQRLRAAVGVLQQSDLVAATESPGILYLDGWTDLELLRAWARVLGHPLRAYLDRTPFWRPKQAPGRPDAREVPPREHFDALRLANERITGVWLVDGDGRERVLSSARPERAQLNRLVWRRYEAESYLFHPTALARFLDAATGAADGAASVRRSLERAFDEYAGKGVGAGIAAALIASPQAPSQIVEKYLATTKARLEILPSILAEGGIHAFDYTRFGEIAATMTPGEVHPEVVEKLDFIQAAFFG